MEGEAGDSQARSSNSNGFGIYAVGDGEPLQDLRRTVTYTQTPAEGTRGAKNTETSVLEERKYL